MDEEKLESSYAKTRKDKIYLQRAACFFIESDYQAADIDATESLKLKLSTKAGISRVRTGCTSRESDCTPFYKIVRYHKIPKIGQFHSWSDIRKPRKIYRSDKALPAGSWAWLGKFWPHLTLDDLVCSQVRRLYRESQFQQSSIQSTVWPESRSKENNLVLTKTAQNTVQWIRHAIFTDFFRRSSLFWQATRFYLWQFLGERERRVAYCVYQTVNCHFFCSFWNALSSNKPCKSLESVKISLTICFIKTVNPFSP